MTMTVDTPEGRAELRKLCEAATIRDTNFIVAAREALPAALDALDARDAEIARLRAALRELAEANVPSQPMSSGMSEEEWARFHIRWLRTQAQEALKP